MLDLALDICFGIKLLFIINIIMHAMFMKIRIVHTPRTDWL